MRFIKTALSLLLALALCASAVACNPVQNPSGTKAPSLDNTGSGNTIDGITATMKSYQSQLTGAGTLIPYTSATSVLAETTDDAIYIVNSIEDINGFKDKNAPIFNAISELSEFTVNEEFFASNTLIVVTVSNNSTTRPKPGCIAVNSTAVEVGIIHAGNAASTLGSTSYCVMISVENAHIGSAISGSITHLMATSKTK